MTQWGMDTVDGGVASADAPVVRGRMVLPPQCSSPVGSDDWWVRRHRPNAWDLQAGLVYKRLYAKQAKMRVKHGMQPEQWEIKGASKYSCKSDDIRRRAARSPVHTR